jgi:uncharacterized Zn finger protein (UPF0148 family)
MSEQTCPKCGAGLGVKFNVLWCPTCGDVDLAYRWAVGDLRRQVAAVTAERDGTLEVLTDVARTLKATEAERNAAVQRAEAAEAIVAKLPKTADGVTCYIGDVLWVVYEGRVLECEPLNIYSDSHLSVGAHFAAKAGYRNRLVWVDGWHRPEDCYSTRAAAEQAQAEKEAQR